MLHIIKTVHIKNIQRLYMHIILMFLSQNILAQNTPNIKITNIPSLSKLPVSAIHRVFQDSEGYMWYGTVNGLCRDDGYHVKVFRSDINTPGLILDNLVECISEGPDGKIWFGTDHGAYIIDKKNGYKLTPLYEEKLAKQFIHGIWATSEGSMWVAINGELLRFDSKGNLKKTYKITSFKGHPSKVNKVYESRQKDIWVTVNKSFIHKLDKESDELCPIDLGCPMFIFTDIIQDKDNDYFWVGTWYNGIVKFNPWADKDEVYTSFNLPLNSVGKSEERVMFVVQDKYYGNLWITGRTDLIVLNYDNKNNQMSIVSQGLLSQSNKMLHEIINDSHGNIWVSAFDVPSFIISFGTNRSTEYPLTALRDRVEFNPAIMAISDAGAGKLWLSQERTGLCLYDMKNDKVSFYTDFNEISKLELDAIKFMTSSINEGNVWIIPEGRKILYEMSHDGMNIKCNKTIRFDSSKSSFSYFTKALQENDSLIWIGTDKNIFSYNLKRNKIETKLDSVGNVTMLIKGENGDIWFGTMNNGLYSYSNNKLEHYDLNYYISCAAIPMNNCLWIGTYEGGLFYFDRNNNKFIDFTDKCELDGDMINQLYFDVYNHLWIDTNQKIIEFNPKNNSLLYYHTSDPSVKMTRFIPTAICSTADGKILFGGIPGVFAVSPSDLLDRNGGNIKTFITDIEINGNSIMVGKNEFKDSKELTLKFMDKDLKIYFSSLNYLNAPKIRYAYRLVGLDKEWNFTSIGENFVSYKHLPKGNYTFEVKATDEHGLWSETITSFEIKCLPAFYETWWAKLSYFISATMFIGFIAYYDIKKRTKKNEEIYLDSVELSKMREYLLSENNRDKSDIKITETEIVQLDELLLEKILKAVEDNMAEPDFDVSVLADKVGMSRSSLTRKLKSITGLTPLEYIKKVKMKHAKLLLEDHSKTVAEITLSLGYFNRKHFTQCFKEEFGITPSEYQKSVSEKRQEGDFDSK